MAGRCLYGVDKNPLAAEMAKLSLWLLTLQKDKPFTFLDHAIRSGDSLVGIANTHQLTSFSLDGNGPDMPMFTDAIKKRLDAVRMLRRQIAEMADNSRRRCRDEGPDASERRAADQAARLCRQLPVGRLLGSDFGNRPGRTAEAGPCSHVEYNFKDLPVEQLEAEGKTAIAEGGMPEAVPLAVGVSRGHGSEEWF